MEFHDATGVVGDGDLGNADVRVEGFECPRVFVSCFSGVELGVEVEVVCVGVDGDCVQGCLLC